MIGYGASTTQARKKEFFSRRIGSPFQPTAFIEIIIPLSAMSIVKFFFDIKAGLYIFFGSKRILTMIGEMNCDSKIQP